MDLEKIYYDQDGNECNILQLVAREPAWAANRIQEGEKAIARLKEISQDSSRCSGHFGTPLEFDYCPYGGECTWA